MSLARAYFGMKTPDWVMTARRMLTDVPSADRLRLWARLLANCPHGVSESFCHPGHAHEDPQDSPAMRARRVEELKILTSHEIRDSVEEHGIELISYRDI
mgnify:CR=1 FL=1